MALAMKASKTGSKAMKAMKVTKVMKKKAMKAKRVAKVAKGRMAKAMVLAGKREKTTGGLKQDNLTKNKNGKVVSKKASAHGKRAFRHIEGWVEAVMAAREALHTKGFVAINGKSLQGQALYGGGFLVLTLRSLSLMSPAATEEIRL
ncbi:unnamed protein product [Polarella glacialis]|uniref:Uncharacterized protein n=2 Tax=Polarella glacialis TaxID=89957 RepID=A0A813ELK2_POLGL|nr:unnamed protein product [Polarella glacialis]